ncbi:hypothetical protein [Roseimicrobium sp. ORNL1]|uniref:hypothetical protein n=1 Tax=Roseimicrobium sp. ORNL1 TaxID=2711231 RepID=UPI0013E16DB9|nr:hypothetical protein [Roseimicrobium sp. ORNL1]QIF02536.1 hypothetical protein G5S37_13710 [Roseimicrobium sp. ORNL1]
MNELQSRRAFLSNVGKGTIAATIGPALAGELGLAPSAAAADGPKALNFGDMEPLVCFMQETPIAGLQAGLAEKVKAGVPLKKLVAAGVLANARTFGGEDYVGFHTLMALSPALSMSANMASEKEKALPIFKVLYRNTNRIQEHGGRGSEVLHEVDGLASGLTASPTELLQVMKTKDEAATERMMARMISRDPEEAFDALLYCVQENPEVHRTVLPYRAWDLLDVVGDENASTMLRQSLHYCLKSEKYRKPEWEEHSRMLTKLLDEYKLLEKGSGTRSAEDAYVEELSKTIFEGTAEQAAGAVAHALAEGFDPMAIGEAISLAANQLVLRDVGRPPAWESPGKPVGSVHGDSVGVHASDSVHAWRNLADIAKGRNAHACLILGAWQVARDRGYSGEGRDFLKWEPIPSKHQIGSVKGKDQDALLAELDEAIKGNLQAQSSAIVHQCGQLGIPEKSVFQRLLRYAVSEDGALHAEKYYQTTWDEFHRTRPSFRWRHLVGLARVTASEYGRPAAGQAEARELLGV